MRTLRHGPSPPQDARIEAALQRVGGRLRQMMTRELNMKYSPTLAFKRSDTRRKQQELDELFARIKERA